MEMRTLFSEMVELAVTNPKIQFGRFRPGKGGEDERIRKNWKKLVHRLNKLKRVIFK
jgi:hypothetical protein